MNFEDLKKLSYKFRLKYLHAKPVFFDDLILKYKRKPENGFEHILSLGCNCEIAFREVTYFDFEESNLFNWCAIFSFDHLIDVIDDVNKVGSEGYTADLKLEMSQCNKTKMWFHHKTHPKQLEGESLLDAINRDTKERMDYLKNKFTRVMQSNDKKLYIYAVRKDDLKEDINEKIQVLYNKMVEKGAKNFKLLILCEEKDREMFNVGENIMLRTVKYFAPKHDVVNKKYFNNGFKDIFNEFYFSKKPKVKKSAEYKFNRKK